MRNPSSTTGSTLATASHAASLAFWRSSVAVLRSDVVSLTFFDAVVYSALALVSASPFAAFTALFFAARSSFAFLRVAWSDLTLSLALTSYLAVTTAIFALFNLFYVAETAVLASPTAFDASFILASATSAALFSFLASFPSFFSATV